MKRFLLTTTFLMLATLAWAQLDNLTEYNRDRLEKQRVSMMVLGGWAIGNIAVGAAVFPQNSGEKRYFHLMNAGWNLVNLGLATAGYLSAVKADPAGFDLYQSVQEQHRLQKILLFNAGLDVGYVLGGLYLRERAKNAENNPERLRGFGKSIILQGAFLFAFDLTAHFIQASNNPKLEPFLSGLMVSPQGASLVLQF